MASAYAGQSRHAVTFDANSGTGSMAIQSNGAGATLNLTANTFTYSGFRFNGWNTVRAGTGTAYADSAQYTFTASTTLYAQWLSSTPRTISIDSGSYTSTYTLIDSPPTITSTVS